MLRLAPPLRVAGRDTRDAESRTVADLYRPIVAIRTPPPLRDEVSPRSGTWTTPSSTQPAST